MTRNTHIVALATVAVALLSAQLASAAPAPPVDLGPNKSVRPNSAQIRTSVGPLLGWQVGISSSVFGPLSFSAATAHVAYPRSRRNATIAYTTSAIASMIASTIAQCVRSPD